MTAKVTSSASDSLGAIPTAGRQGARCGEVFSRSSVVTYSAVARVSRAASTGPPRLDVGFATPILDALLHLRIWLLGGRKLRPLGIGHLGTSAQANQTCGVEGAASRPWRLRESRCQIPDSPLRLRDDAPWACKLKSAMRYRYVVRIGPEDIGRRVVVRWHRPAASGSGEDEVADVVGPLEACDENGFAVRNRRGELVLIPRSRSRRTPVQDIGGETIGLQDGRRLGYAQWGDPGDQPLIHFHGWPGSRAGGRWCDQAARPVVSG